MSVGLPTLGVGNVGGASPLLNGLAALAQAVPAYFQGRQLGMQTQEEGLKLQEEQTALLQERLKAIGPAAAMGVPGATEEFQRLVQQLTGGSIGATPAPAQAKPVATGGAMPSLSTVVPGQQAQPAQAQAGAQPGVAQGGAAQGIQPAQGASAPSSSQQLLEAYGYLTPAQQYLHDNIDKVVQLPPEQRISELQAMGIPLTPQDVQLISGLPFRPDPTKQEAVLSEIDRQIANVAGGKLTPDQFRAIVMAHGPLLQQYNIDPTAFLTDQRLTQMTNNATLTAMESAARLGLTKAQTERIKRLTPLEAKKYIADTFHAYASGHEAEVRAAAIPVQLAQAWSRISNAAANLDMRQKEFGLKLQAATTTGSPANILGNMRKDLDQRRKDLTMWKSYLGGLNGVRSFVTGKVKLPDGTMVDTQQLTAQIEAVQQDVNQREYLIHQFEAHHGLILDNSIHKAGVPDNTHVTKDAKGNTVDTTKPDAAPPPALLSLVKQGYKPQKRNGKWGVFNPADGQWYPSPGM